MLVNNLDLEVVPPGAASPLLGNNDADAPAQVADTLNNMEKVWLPAAAATGRRLARAAARARRRRGRGR